MKELKPALRRAEQLQKAVELGDYGEAAHLLEAVQQLAAHFKAFASIPKIAELSGRLAGLEVQLSNPVQSRCCDYCAISASCDAKPARLGVRIRFLCSPEGW